MAMCKRCIRTGVNDVPGLYSRLCPSLRTGLPNFLDPALQLAVTFEKISRRILLNFKVRSVVVSRYRGGQ
jgi:hypothetical protein